MKNGYEMISMHRILDYLHTILVSCIKITVLKTSEGDREMIIRQKLGGGWL